ncbi:MAG: hypothetical protein P1P71_00185 [Anaerosomatales bacterium]|nr:hypothetical protein [Anaerosomatales bacterium]
MNDLWRSVGALDGVEIYHPETFLTYEHESGTVPIYRDLERLRASWLELSPADADAIEEFIATIRQLGSFDDQLDKPVDMMSLIEKVRYFASMKDAGAVMKRYGKVGLEEYSQRFTHPAIREMFATFAPGDYSSAFLFFGLATFAKGQSSIPVGGSKALADRMAGRYRTLGGRVETGCEGEVGDVPRTVRFDCEPIEVAGSTVTQITLNHYGYEPGFAPAGCTALTVALNHFGEEVDRWFALAQDRTAYRREKERVGEAVRAAIEKQLPQMAGKLTVLDVATPTTYDRYCNAHRGAFMAFFPTRSSKMMAHTGRIKGLEDFVLSGQWLQPPGGLPIALITGKDTIQRLCKKLGRPFTAEIGQDAETPRRVA